MRTPKIKYYNGNKQQGIIYDWTKVIKMYRSLKCPVGFFDPTGIPYNRSKYNIIYSARGGGKTINVQLFGMCLNALYGAKMVYIRSNALQIAPKNVSNMFNVIKEFGYIYQITDGRWNSCILDKRHWYYCNVDDNGLITERCADWFMFMASIEEAGNLKSGWNEPRADFIIFDEFIPVDFSYLDDEFPRFCDLLSTICRQRLSCVITMLANNTDKESIYFHEFEIADRVKKMKLGDKFEFDVVNNVNPGWKTPCYIEWFNPDMTVLQKTIRSTINGLFFAFNNPRLSAITNEGWQVKPRQHFPERSLQGSERVEEIISNLFILYHDHYVRLLIVMHPKLGVCCYVHNFDPKYLQDNSIILTLDDRYDNRYRYGLGIGNLRTMLTWLCKENRIYFHSNDVASFWESYLNECANRHA